MDKSRQQSQSGLCGCCAHLLATRRRSAEYLQDDPDAQQAYSITSMEMFSLQGTMYALLTTINVDDNADARNRFINADTLLSLQIIQPESHPNAFNQGPGSTGSKESLSIYGLFHHLARTPQGHVRLRQYFLRPSLDLEEINTRLDFVTVFVRPDNLIPMQKLSKSMNKVKNMRNTVTTSAKRHHTEAIRNSAASRAVSGLACLSSPITRLIFVIHFAKSVAPNVYLFEPKLSKSSTRCSCSALVGLCMTLSTWTAQLNSIAP